MIKFIKITLLLSIFSLISGTSVAKDRDIARLNGGDFTPFVNKSAVYTLNDSDEAGLFNFTNDIRQAVGSNVHKKVTLVYEKNYKKQALIVRKGLIKKGVLPERIRLIYKKRAIYPLYAKVHSIAKQKSNCRDKRTDLVFNEARGSCAVDSNRRVQSKY
ncbi:Uncharacterised protein [Phocoenobacter uteri]|uniref:Uncharacterized protein n=1 Tax=Phocoenobacter uteri TaxID=146806 RepID=A0A379CAN7_9PAST|nr:hypothetical protein [Phocoenobacter uteri]MDG6882640.1 hypothetical protein [Phocoenobacter uteri]SUB58805.1 Uncharacterised protein [Phocoenobacter uteri]